MLQSALLENWEARKDQYLTLVLGISRDLWAQPSHHLSLLKSRPQDMLPFQHFGLEIMCLRRLFNKGGLLDQHSQKDHCHPEMIQPNSCAPVMALAARRERVEKDHERRIWKPEGIAGNGESNFISTPAGMSVYPELPRAGHNLVRAVDPDWQRRLSTRKNAEEWDSL